jgi:hypothetical protein
MTTVSTTLISLFLSATLLGFTQQGQVDNYRATGISDGLVTTRITFFPAKLPYVGNWSNGRGDTLFITGRTLRFGNDKRVTYRDVTKVTDGNHFSLKITTPGKINYLSKYLALEMSGDEMKMTHYNSQGDMFDGQNPQGEATWYRDK